MKKIYTTISIWLYPTWFLILAFYIVFFKDNTIPKWAMVTLIIIMANFITALILATPKKSNTVSNNQ
jgi:hypothetical protein